MLGNHLSGSVRDGAGTGLARTYSACLEAPRLLDQGGSPWVRALIPIIPKPCPRSSVREKLLPDEGFAAVHRSRNNRHLQVPVAMLHVPKETRKFTQRDLSRDEIGAPDVTACDCIECLANKTWRMVESGSNCDFRVVEKGGVQLHTAFSRATAEQVHRSAATHHPEGPLPRQGGPNRLDGRVRAVRSVGEPTHSVYGIEDA